MHSYFFIMKFFLFLLLVFYFTLEYKAQNTHALSMNYSFGIPTRYMKPLSTGGEGDASKAYLNYHNFLTNYKNTTRLNYAWEFNKKIQLGVVSNIAYHQISYNYLLPVTSGVSLNNVKINNSFASVSIGVDKRTTISPKLNLDFSISLIKRFALEKRKTYSTNGFVVSEHANWIEYSYDFEIINDKFYENNRSGMDRERKINLEYSLSLNYKFYSNWSFRFSMTYSRNWDYFLIYDVPIKKTYGPDENGNSTIETINFRNFGGNFINHHGIRDHFLDLGVGLTYSF